MIEFQYPSHAGHWFYAPQMRVTAAGGMGSVRITGAEFRIPGHTTWMCTTDQSVAADETKELFPSLYGDYPLSFDYPGRRSVGLVGMVIYFVDQSGQTGALTITVPITPGNLPTEYQGGKGTWLGCERVRG